MRKENIKIHVKKGDTVKVISGEEKGKTSEIIKVFPEEYKALVKGLNLVTKHVKPTQQKPSGEIIKKEAPIHISNLMLVVAGTPTKIGRKLNEKGKLQRFSKVTGEFIN